MESSKLLKLMAWMSPSFPVGAFSYSHGIEYAVDAGLVRDKTTLQDWLESIVRHGTGRVDAILFAAAYRSSGDDLRSVVELATAMRGTSELAKESAAQGQAFLNTVRRVWPCPALDELADDLVRNHLTVVHSAAVAVVCSMHGVPLEQALTAYLHSFTSNLVSAGLRLIPLGQTEGQMIIAGLEGAITAIVNEAMACSLEDMGSSTPMVDMTSMLHENQYTRLFRS
jgi:urease accessory protein